MAKGNTWPLGGGVIWKMTKPSTLIIMGLKKSVSFVSLVSLFSFFSLGSWPAPSGAPDSSLNRLLYWAINNAGGFNPRSGRTGGRRYEQWLGVSG